jgi:hypothetical protein
VVVHPAETGDMPRAMLISPTGESPPRSLRVSRPSATRHPPRATCPRRQAQTQTCDRHNTYTQPSDCIHCVNLKSPKCYISHIPYPISHIPYPTSPPWIGPIGGSYVNVHTVASTTLLIPSPLWKVRAKLTPRSPFLCDTPSLPFTPRPCHLS